MSPFSTLDAPESLIAVAGTFKLLFAAGSWVVVWLLLLAFVLSLRKLKLVALGVCSAGFVTVIFS